MMKDLTSKVGLEFTPFCYPIERGKIKEFARAIGDDNPIYYSVEEANKAGFHDIPIPPTFPIVIDMWEGPDFDQLMKALNVNPLKVLHGEMQYSYLGNVCAGEFINGKSKVTRVEEKKGMNLFTIETKYVNQVDELVLISTSVVIERL